MNLIKQNMDLIEALLLISLIPIIGLVFSWLIDTYQEAFILSFYKFCAT